MKTKISGPSPPDSWRRRTSAATSREDSPGVAPAADVDAVRQDAGDPRERRRRGDGPRASRRGRRSGPPTAPWRRTGRRDTGPRGRSAARPTTPSAASSFWPTIRRWLPPSRRNRAEVGSLIAMASPSQAWTDRGDAGHAGASSRCAQQRVERQVGRRVALEDDRRPGQGRLPHAGPARGAAPGTPRDARRRARRPGRSGCPRARRWRRCRSPRRAARASSGATLFSLRIRWASVSLHCRAIRTAIWPSVLRARLNAPLRLCEPSRTWMPNARPCRTRRSSQRAASCASLSSSTKNSWNSSTISRMRGKGREPGGVAIAVDVLHAGLAEPVGPHAAARRRAAGGR